MFSEFCLQLNTFHNFLQTFVPIQNILHLPAEFSPFKAEVKNYFFQVFSIYISLSFLFNSNHSYFCHCIY